MLQLFLILMSSIVLADAPVESLTESQLITTPDKVSIIKKILPVKINSNNDQILVLKKDIKLLKQDLLTKQKLIDSLVNKALLTKIIVNNCNTNNTEVAMYHNAIVNFQSKRYKKSFDLFKDYLRKYPHSTYSADAYYWLGELSILLYKDLTVEYWQKIIEDYPEYKLIDKIYLKLAINFEQKNDHKKAQFLLNRLLILHPKSFAARIARTKLERDY